MKLIFSAQLVINFSLRMQAINSASKTALQESSSESLWSSDSGPICLTRRAAVKQAVKTAKKQGKDTGKQPAKRLSAAGVQVIGNSSSGIKATSDVLTVQLGKRPRQPNRTRKDDH
jgi:hypothetical protein